MKWQPVITSIFLLLVLASPILAAFADFDALGEGFYGQTLAQGGITFYNVNEHLSIGPGGTFAVDNVSAVIPLVPEWAPFISSPNCLGMTGYGIGPTGLGSRFGELSLTTGRTEHFGSIDVFVSDWGMPSDFAISLEAYHSGSLVATDSVPLGLQQTRHEALTISGVDFDSLRLTATGPDPAKAYFVGAIDNVVITPEPSLAAMLLLGGLCMCHRRRESHLY